MDTTNKKFKTINIDGTKYKTLLTKKFENRTKWEVPDDHMVKSQIPGTIVKISVKDGDKVKAGDKMLILEAMKMKNQILVPFDGVIKKIHVTLGQKVSKNILLAEME